MPKAVIVWDIDDVLNDLMREWFKEFSKAFHTNVNYEDLIHNPPCDILKIPLDSYLNSLDDFRERKMLNLAPAKEVMEWFEQHGAGYRHIALTAVPLKFAHFSAQWLFANYGKWFREFHFVPSPRKTDEAIKYDKNKGDILKRLDRVDFFIDDNEANISQAKELGIKTIVFPRPWNKQRHISIEKSLESIQA